MKKEPQGTAVIFLETDLEKARPFDENMLSDLQKIVFAQLGVDTQKKIREGYAALVMDLENKKTVCEFTEI